MPFAVDADICDIPHEHAVEELDVVRCVVVAVVFGELDGELGIVPRGLEDVAPLGDAKRGRGRHGGYGERPCGVERRFEQDRARAVVVVVVRGSEDENEQDVLRHLCGRGDVERDVFEHELAGECPG